MTRAVTTHRVVLAALGAPMGPHAPVTGDSKESMVRAVGTDGAYRNEKAPTWCRSRAFSSFLSLRLLQNEGEDIAKNQIVSVDEFPRHCSSGAKVFARSTNHNIGVAWANYGYFAQIDFTAAQPREG